MAKCLRLYVMGFEPTRTRLPDPTLTTLSTMLLRVILELMVRLANVHALPLNQVVVNNLDELEDVVNTQSAIHPDAAVEVVNASVRRRHMAEIVKATASRFKVPSNVSNTTVPDTNPANVKAMGVGGKLVDA
ncbi:hypothetical protein E2C01_062925 [Portunus trituberculatus]|uniref:Uncharacterized protein n=1 Tax=Portunus trituberculatus TaxID=210409 RepID=A0A5B7H972_PORTR|nr:hypothetical protein [Portunus trituberculatus]